jgi:hypothetical protein
VRAAGKTEPATLQLFAQASAGDEVVLEATANALAIAPHVRRIVLSNPRAVPERMVGGRGTPSGWSGVGAPRADGRGAAQRSR